MKSYTESFSLQSARPREVSNITTRVKAAIEKSSFRDGIILVSSLQSNSAVIAGEEAPVSLEGLDGWGDRIAHAREDYKDPKSPDGAAPCPPGLLPHQVVVSFTESRFDLAPRKRSCLWNLTRCAHGGSSSK